VVAPAPAYEPVGPIVHRRQILAAVPPLLAGAALGLSLSELHRFRVRRMQLPLRGLPAALDGMTIAHVCDTHIGRFTDDAMLRDITRATNDLDADLTLFIGDLIDVALADLGPAIAFAKTLRGRYGVYFCEGNHDLIDDTAHETRVFETATRDAGLAMLFDETATVWVRGVPIQLVGGRWNQTPKRRVQQTTALMRLVDPGVFSIFLSHHPHAWDQSITPLTLSGHTHGGQLMLNERLGVGPIMFRYWSGLYQRGDQTLVVCNGTGNWYPLRTNAPAEIIHLTLRCVS
jgi:predicted MPP superfamily phosphohydrolase